MRVYISFRFSSRGKRLGPYLRGYRPRSGGRRARVVSLPRYLHNDFLEEAEQQHAQRQARKQQIAAEKQITRIRGHHRRGRPKEVPEGFDETLESIGCYRQGQRIIQSRKMCLEERARRRYSFLDSDIRALICEEQYCALEARILSLRKTANRLSLPWCEAEARQQAFEELFGGEK